LNIDITYLDYQIGVFFDWEANCKYKVIRKGRRVGITRGGAHAVIEWLLEGNGPVLWGETTHGNIERYFERYFYPVLNKNKIQYKFDRQSKKLTINRHYCDFRSADNPENWEGFGYKYIFLNEAGIILKDRSLYINSVLPMLLDYPDSKLIAAGVPKGKYLKDGNEHPFYTLNKRAEEGNEQYKALHFTSYENPLLSEEDIKELEREIEVFSPEQVRQEIYGEFIETDALNPFAHQYKKEKHESEQAIFRPEKQIIISVDFNINPFAATFRHMWEDSQGLHYHVFDELEIKNGSIPQMAEQIIARYNRYLGNSRMTGDAMGNAQEISEQDKASLYKQLIRQLKMSETQLIVPANPKHKNSRADVNYVLANYPDYKINPKTCPNLCRDMAVVQCNVHGEKVKIAKTNRADVAQRADFLDTERYAINTFLSAWVERHSKMRR